MKRAFTIIELIFALAAMGGFFAIIAKILAFMVMHRGGIHLF